MNLALAPTLATPDIKPAHWDEWVNGSGVDPGVVRLNVRSLEDFKADALTHEANFEIAELLGWHVVRFGQQVKIRQELRGWWVNGVDPLNDFSAMEWGRFKPDPDTPVIDHQKGEPAKYLSPKGQGSRATFLRVTWDIGRMVAQGSNMLDEYEQRFANACSRGEAFYETEEDRGFWRWVKETPKVQITLTEGEKKAGCLLSAGFAAIALPGITMGVRTKDPHGNPIRPRLIPELQEFVCEGREVYVCFDYETKTKVVKNIKREITKLSRCIKPAGGICKIVELLGPQKGVDDFILAQGLLAYEECYERALTYDKWEVRDYSRLSYSASLRVNQRYLDVQIPVDAKLACLKSPKGTGKTQSFIPLVEEATREGRRVLLIGHRVQLVQAIADRVGLPYVTELKTAGEGSLLGYGLCIDSLHPESQARFNHDEWDNALVIIDECEQVIWHLLSASTEINRRRVIVLQELKELLVSVLESDRGQIVLSDADLSDLSIDFIRQLTGHRVQPWIAVNDWTPSEPWNVHNYTTPERWFTNLAKSIEEGHRPFIVTHAQKPKSKWGTRNLEATLKELFPDKKILCIDSWSISDPKHPAYGCISKLNTILLEYDIAIASPSIETGVSIDIRGHFTSVWGWAGGVVTDSSARQSLARLREPVERHIYAAAHGLGRIGNGAISIRSLLASQHKMAKANIKQLQSAIIDFDGDTLQVNSAGLSTWAKMACRINAGMGRYRDSILEGLRAEGHNIIQMGLPDESEALASINHRAKAWIETQAGEMPPGGDSGDLTCNPVAAVNNLAKTAEIVRDRNYEVFCKKPCEAEAVSDSKAEELKSKKSKTEDEWHQLRRHQIEKRYGVEITPELVAKDDSGWYPKIRMHYYLTIGRQFLEQREKQTFDAARSEGGELWLPSFNRSQLSAQIMILDLLGIRKLMDVDREYSKDDQDLMQMAEMAQAHAWEIRAALGISISEKDTPIAIAQKLLGKIGQKLTYQGRLGARGSRQRLYRFVPTDDGRRDVFTRWLERDELAQNQSVSTPGINKETNSWTQGGTAA